MRIRLNTKADQIEVQFAGIAGKVDDFDPSFGDHRTLSIAGEDGRGAEVLIDLDGFVREIRVAKLSQMIAEFAPTSAASVGKKGKR